MDSTLASCLVHQPSAYRRWGKRALDLGLGCIALLFALPVMLVTAVLIRIVMGSPVLFRQTRPGLNGIPFSMIKFRTMTDARDARGTLLPDSQRLTRLGRVLRACSLDELPELWHVLCGTMSIVGPRPLLMEYLPAYTPGQFRRHAVLPGITGLAQVRQRNDTTWEKRFVDDLFYVRSYSLRLDLRILLWTVAAIMRGDGGMAQIERLGKFGTQPRANESCRPKAKTNPARARIDQG